MPPLRPTLLAAAALLLASVAPISAAAQARPYTPVRGSVERQQIMDALRVPIRRELSGKPVTFEVLDLMVQNGWAFVHVGLLQPNGARFDYTGTQFDDENLTPDEGTWALLRFRNGRWTVVEYVIGPTDVAWLGWEEQHGAPRAIFPYPDEESHDHHR